MENTMSQDPNDKSRRQFLATSTVLGAAGALWSALPFSGSAHASTQGGSMTADLILFNGKLHTVDRENPTPPPSPSRTASSSRWATMPGHGPQRRQPRRSSTSNSAR
jgi:hypothetical protein